jgi:type VI secretion system secreted protein VgrG
MEQFIVTSGALPSGARVMGFVGSEGISELYGFDVFVALEDGRGAQFEIDDAHGARASILIVSDPTEPPFFFHGVLSDVEIVHETEERVVVRLHLAPALHHLRTAQHSRIFTKKTVPQIIAQVLSDSGFSGEDFELRLREVYAVEEHVTQYRETDLAFLMRWMEREGMFFFFEHRENAEKLIIADHASAHEPSSARPVRYFADDSGAIRGEALSSVSSSRALRPGVVTVADYDYARPTLVVRGTAQVWDQSVVSAVHHGARFFDPAAGARLARLRAEEAVASAQALRARGGRKHLRSGYLFELVEHPRAELNATYLARRVRHAAREQGGQTELDGFIPREVTTYQVEVEAGPATIPYRHPARTPWPKVHGFENGTVDGPATSDYAQIDDQGRYAVKLHFDEAASSDGNASTFVRMAQPHGGGVEGFHFPLRKRTEVLVEFLDGDPDRPVIAAVLPNAATPSPVTERNYTKNVLQTGGTSRVEIEDENGGQYMHTSVPIQSTSMYMGADGTAPGGHNAEISSNGSAVFSYGTYLDRFVGGYKTDKVVGAFTRGYDSTYTTTVAQPVTQTYQANQCRVVIVDVQRTILGAATATVDGSVQESFDATLALTVDADVTETFLAKHDLRVGGTQDVTVTGAGKHTLQTGLGVTVNGGLSKHTATAGYKLEVVPDARMHAHVDFSIRGDAKAQLGSPDTTVGGDATVDVDGGSTVEIKSANVAVNGSALIRGSSPKIDILGGDIHVSGINLTFTAGGTFSSAAAGNLIAKGTSVTVNGGSLVDVHAGVIQLNLSPAPATSGLGPEYDALLALDPVLAARVRLLLAAGWTIEWGDNPALDLARKVIVLDRANLHDPAAALAEFAAITGAPAGTNALLGLNPDILATFSGDQTFAVDGRHPHWNACGAYAGTSLFMLYQGTHGGLGSSDFATNLGTVMPEIATNDPVQWAISHVTPLFAGTDMGTNGAWLPGSVEGGLDSLGVPATSGAGLTQDQLKHNIDNGVATMIAYDPSANGPNGYEPLPWTSTAGHWGTAVGYTDDAVLIMDNTGGISSVPWSELPARQELGTAATLLVPDGSFVEVPLVP